MAAQPHVFLPLHIFLFSSLIKTKMSFSDYWNLAKGWFGYSPEQKVGKDLGGYLGQLGQAYIPIPGVNGKQFGEWVGSFLPFKQGGRIGGLFAQDYRPPPYIGSWDDYGFGGLSKHSFSDIRNQLESEEDMIPMKKGGRVKKRKHT
jgi:hypothetical protein